MTKPDNIVLVGARLDGQAGVVLALIRQHRLYDVAGFVDDDPTLLGGSLAGIPVVGGIAAFIADPRRPADAAHICIGDNTARERCFDELCAAGIRVVNVVHPSAVIAGDAQIGDGVFIGPNAVIMNGSTLGNGTTVNTAATIDHDNRLDDFANVSPGSHTSGRVHIKRRAFLGTGTTIVPDITIGRDAFVGAGSLVTKDVPDGVRVAGVPARRIR